MRNGTCCTSKLRAKSPFNLKIIHRKNTSFLVEPHSRSWVRGSRNRGLGFYVPASGISPLISAGRGFTHVSKR